MSTSVSCQVHPVTHVGFRNTSSDVWEQIRVSCSRVHPPASEESAPGSAVSQSSATARYPTQRPLPSFFCHPSFCHSSAPPKKRCFRRKVDCNTAKFNPTSSAHRDRLALPINVVSEPVAYSRQPWSPRLNWSPERQQARMSPSGTCHKAVRARRIIQRQELLE